MKRWATIPILLAIFLVVSAIPAMGQGVTTATMRGQVTDDTGEPLPGANVIAVHEPSGTQYGTTSNPNGRFTLPNMRVGGPYRLRVTFVGYEPYTQTGLTLDLNQVYELDVELRPGTEELEGVEVTAERGGIFNAERTGIERSIGADEIDSAPTLGRDLADYTRLTPQAYVENDDDDGPAISIAGQNNRFNSIFIDGAVNNDVFGLSAQGTNGGQTGVTPISLDAIEQFQVSLSPFDVTQSGFTGGAINAVTRSGTNQLEGSFYYFGRRDWLTGRDPIAGPDGVRGRLNQFSDNRFGFRLGGPIVQDELFFFVNAEYLDRAIPQPYAPSTYIGDSGDDTFETIQSVLQQELNFDPGSFRDKTTTVESPKVFAKLNWNVSQNHKLMLRHSYTKGENTDQFRSASGEINYTSSAEVFPSTTNSTAFEVNSTFGDNMSNKFILGYTRVRDDRNAAAIFPTINITDGQGEINLGAEPFSTANILEQDVFTVTNNFSYFVGDHTLTVGTHNEFYSIFNNFIPFNYGWYFYDSPEQFLEGVCAAGGGQSSFCQNNYPNAQDAVIFAQRGFSIPDLRDGTGQFGDNANSSETFNAFQLGLYAQDEWRISDNFRLTFGLRLDVPKITTEPPFYGENFDGRDDGDGVFNSTLRAIREGEEIDVQADPNDPLQTDVTFTNVSGFDGYDLKGAEPGKTPAAQFLLSPRAGFNWDVQGDNATQIRGGVGIFTGRVPYVWPGGMFLNNGVSNGIYARFGENPLRPDPANGLTPLDFPSDFGGVTSAEALAPSGRLEIFEDDFKYPQVVRTNLGIDQRLPYGFVATLEGQYTKTLSNLTVFNMNIKPANATLNGPDDRPIWAYGTPDDGEWDISEALIDPRYEAIHRVGSTSKGYTYDITGRLQNTVDTQYGLFNSSVSYTYGDAFAVNDGTSSQINSNWEDVENVNGLNGVGRSRSDFSIGHRVLASFRYKVGGTELSVLYNGESGRPFSYIIGGSGDGFMVGAGGGGDDRALFYVPENASNLVFEDITVRGQLDVTAEQQAQALDAFINGIDALSETRGGYMERNDDRTPFEHVVDLRFRQEIFGEFFDETFERQQSLEFTLDIFNFTNLLNEKWGRRYFGVGDFSVTEFENFVDGPNGDYTPVYSFTRPFTNFLNENPQFDGTSLTQDELERAIEAYDSKDDVFRDQIIDSGSNYGSRWQIQIGFRYTF
ncbi:TonB-dependent receptor [Longibacter salinarum]|nr:TonB-dependent receptor [Longibacter salinarum]